MCQQYMLSIRRKKMTHVECRLLSLHRVFNRQDTLSPLGVQKTNNDSFWNRSDTTGLHCLCNLAHCSLNLQDQRQQGLPCSNWHSSRGFIAPESECAWRHFFGAAGCRTRHCFGAAGCRTWHSTLRLGRGIQDFGRRCSDTLGIGLQDLGCWCSDTLGVTLGVE